MKKIYIVILGIAFCVSPLESKSEVEEIEGESITIKCPSGDKYICMDSHGTLGTVYKGKGKIAVIQ